MLPKTTQCDHLQIGAESFLKLLELLTQWLAMNRFEIYDVAISREYDDSKYSWWVNVYGTYQ